jgi:excinuclease ABC subunit A
MREADWIVDIGPGAGIHGGELVRKVRWRISARRHQHYGSISPPKKIKVPEHRVRATAFIEIKGATQNNLRVDVKYRWA